MGDNLMKNSRISQKDLNDTQSLMSSIRHVMSTKHDMDVYDRRYCYTLIREDLHELIERMESSL